MADCTCERLMHESGCPYDGPDISADVLAAVTRETVESDRAVDVTRQALHIETAQGGEGA